MKKLAVFIICSFVMMIVIGLAIHYAELSDVVKTVVISAAMFTPLVAVIITQLLFKEPLLKGQGINLVDRLVVDSGYFTPGDGHVVAHSRLLSVDGPGYRDQSGCSHIKRNLTRRSS